VNSLDKLKKKIKYILIPIFSILFSLLIGNYYIQHIYIPSLTPLYHYQEGVCLFEQTENDKITYSKKDKEPDFRMDIYNNGFYSLTYFKKGTEEVDSKNYGKLSKKELKELSKLLKEIDFKNMEEFIFNGYLNGKGYEFTTYENNKTVQGFNLTISSSKDFDELQKEHYKETLDDEMKFVKIRELLMKYIK